ncbi:MAG: hypothetical protein IPM46_08990 [Flavobacteriales bacterium]|nr:hypothetical protein [Flavobacteriales bacterium]
MELQPFFAHAVADGFRAESRDLPFHWDFQQSDRFIIDLEFTAGGGNGPHGIAGRMELPERAHLARAAHRCRACVSSLLQVSDETEHRGRLGFGDAAPRKCSPSRLLRVRVSKAPEH